MAIIEIKYTVILGLINILLFLHNIKMFNLVINKQM